MKKGILTTLLGMTLVTVLSVSCNNEKDYFNEKELSRMENPLKITTTDDFTWKNMSKVGLTVKVDDQYNGTYTYGVQVFDKNPITNTDATLLAQGTATGAKPFFANVEVGKGISTLFIRKTTPTGEELVRSAEVSGATATVDFAETYKLAKSVLGARNAKADYNLPTMPDASAFPTQAPSDAQTVANITASGNYILNSNVVSVKANNVNLYVTGNVTLKNNDFIQGKNVNIYILPGATMTMDTKYRWILSNEKETIYISAGGTFNKTGEYPELGLSGTSAVYNCGTMNMRLIECHDSSILYNLYTGIINGGQNKGSFLAFHQNSYFINDGKVSVYEFNEVRDDRAGNVYNYGKVDITELTHVSAIHPVWINEGEWVTKNFDYAEQAQGNNVLNKCKLTVTEKMQVFSNFNVDAGGSVVTKDLLMTKGGINLGSGALFRVNGTATYKYENGVFKGVGSENALLIMNCATTDAAAAVSSSQTAHYQGKLVVACDNYQGEKNVTTAGGALLTSNVNKTGVHIPVTECNPGHEEAVTPPANVDFHYAVTYSAIYAMEDQWPAFGDYDMNDVVMKLVITAQGEGAASNETEAKKIPLTQMDVAATFMATGAEYNIGAYVQLDKVNANVATLTATQGISIEDGQNRLVLKLADNVATLMGNHFVNVKGTRDPSLYKTVSGKFTIPANVITSEALTFDNINFFITINASSTGARKEVHLKNFSMTNKGQSSGSVQKDKYCTADNFVWGVCMPGATYNWPDEKVSIKNVNPEFVDWVTSGGVSSTQWYTASLQEIVTPK